MSVDTPARNTVIPSAPKAIGKLEPRWFTLASASFVKFSALVIQVGLLALLIWRYKLESPAFFQLTLLTFAGFTVNYFLPLAYRLPFFLALSVAGIVMVLGWEASAWLISIGLLLLSVCHLPAAFSVRMAVLAVLVGLLAALRVGWIPAPVPMAVWPILASMFMFRLIVYLYHLRFQTAPSSITSRLSYFFMLPNVCFPLFPVVDYLAFVRGYYDGDRNQIHLVGVRWIFRGIVHLMLYRMLYKEWGISWDEVANAGDLLHYCLWLFLLYLRVSGQFHVIVGFMHLFGFNLSETHKLYFLSSSFTDFWRRINIYWKDFIMKVFFYPTFFRLRKYPQAVALVISALIAFVFTWFLHSMQWFWLRGKFLFVAHDIVFWILLAALVVVNTLWELKFGRKRALSSGSVRWRAAFATGIKTFVTFTVICILWSMWSSESISAWQTLWQYALVPPTAGGWLLMAATLVAIVGGAMLVARYPTGFPWSRLSFVQESVSRCVIMCLLAGLSVNAVSRQLGGVGKWILSAKSGELNAYDMVDLERGYYEDLLDVRAFNGELWTLYARRPPGWEDDLIKAGYANRVGGMLNYELKPSIEGTFKGAMLRTNHYGMHDDEYSQKPPAGCYRIALLGASNAMASGVTRDEDFETLIERRLNRENTGKPYTSYEVLNFAVAGYNPTNQIWVLQDKALAFEPDAVFFVAHANDQKRAVYNLAGRVTKGIALPEPFLVDLCRRAHVDEKTAAPLALRRLQPFGDELYAWILRKIVEICNGHGVRPVFVLLPVLGSPDSQESDLRMAKDAGFIVVDLTGVFGDQYWNKSLWTSEWDGHPNPEGHRMIADRLYELIRRDKAIPFPTATDAAK